MVSASARREQVCYAMVRGLSQRRACALLSVSRSTVGYASTKVEKDVPVLAAMGVLSAQYPRSDNGPEFVSRAILRRLGARRWDAGCCRACPPLLASPKKIYTLCAG